MKKLQGIIDIGASNVEQHEDLLLNTLPLLSILTENVSDLNFDSSLNIQLSRILAASTNPDLAEMCLELLHYQAESDEVKLILPRTVCAKPSTTCWKSTRLWPAQVRPGR